MKVAEGIDTIDSLSYTLRMAMGKRKRARQPTMWVATADVPTAASHPFYARLNQLLREHSFDDFAEPQCAEFYADTYYTNQTGAPPFCYWSNTACSSGIPTCTAGTGVKVDFGCAPYAHAEWLIAQRGTSKTCLFAAVANATGPGPCS